MAAQLVPHMQDAADGEHGNGSYGGKSSVGLWSKIKSGMDATSISIFVVLLLGLIPIIRIQTKKAVQKYNQTQAEVCAVFESIFAIFALAWARGP